MLKYRPKIIQDKLPHLLSACDYVKRRPATMHAVRNSIWRLGLYNNSQVSCSQHLDCINSRGPRASGER